MQKLATASDLQARLQTIIDHAEREFAPLTLEQLRWKPAPNQWSIVECLQHLNLAERFYIHNIQHKVDALGLIQANSADQLLESDLVGKAMLFVVDPQTKLKLPAPGIIYPKKAADLLPNDVVRQFVDLQTLLSTQLTKAVCLDWNREKVISIFGNWLKFRLGDAFRMLVAHSERHMNQAMRVKAEMDTFVA